MQRALLVLLVAASYLLLAGGPAWSLLVLLTMAAAAAVVHPRATLARPLDSLERGALVAAAVIALQAVPLPAPIVDRVSPHALDVRRAIRLGDAVPPLLPLSLDVSATLRALAALGLALITYRVARTVFDHEGGVRRICRFLAWGGGIAALSAVIQRAAAPTLVLGILPPDAPGARPFGPFVNRNHFAAWLLLAIPVVAGHLVAHLRLHLADERRWPRRIAHLLGARTLPLVAGTVVMTAVLLLTLSRSAALGLGVAGATWWWLARPRLGWRRSGWVAAVGAAGLALLVVAVFVDLDGWAARLAHTLSAGPRPDDRFVIWRETLPVVRDFWLTGTGAGTYGLAMIAYQQSRIWVPHLAAWAHFNQAHNHYLQVLAEGGMLLAVPAALALSALAGAARRALESDRSEIFWIRAGAAAALAGIATESVWEIPLTTPANAVFAAVVAAVLLHRPHHAERRRRLRDITRLPVDDADQARRSTQVTMASRVPRRTGRTSCSHDDGKATRVLAS